MVSHSLDVLAQLEPRVPAATAERAGLRSGVSVPVEPSLSASVIVLRERLGELQTYLLHRHARMPFAASMVVFPGGGVDPVDHGSGDPIRACACRETREETGVRLRSADLWAWAHWITPEFEPRRFDTQFFVAELPAGQHAADVSGETDFAAWTAPSAAVAAERSGEIALMPPTLSILLELAEAGTLEAVRDRATDRVIETVLPELVTDGVGWQFRYPEVRR